MNRRSILRLLGLAPIAAPAALAAASTPTATLPVIDYADLTASVGQNVAAITSEAFARAAADTDLAPRIDSMVVTHPVFGFDGYRFTIPSLRFG